jgi:dephospho-CoA kinase
MILVGLTGGIASGKSTIAKMFKRCGAIVIDADELAREVVKPGKSAWREIVKTFGKTILVFGNRTKLRQLERIIHPRVAYEQSRLTKAVARKNTKAVVIYEVPLLYEAGVDTRVDKVIVVTADRETQIARLRKRNGLTRAEAIQRIHSQMPLTKKVRMADFVLQGTLKPALLRQSVRALIRTLQSSPSR